MSDNIVNKTERGLGVAVMLAKVHDYVMCLLGYLSWHMPHKDALKTR